jgi:hypothetical protein
MSLLSGTLRRPRSGDACVRLSIRTRTLLSTHRYQLGASFVAVQYISLRRTAGIPFQGYLRFSRSFCAPAPRRPDRAVVPKHMTLTVTVTTGVRALDRDGMPASQDRRTLKQRQPNVLAELSVTRRGTAVGARLDPAATAWDVLQGRVPDARRWTCTSTCSPTTIQARTWPHLALRLLRRRRRRTT